MLKKKLIVAAQPVCTQDGLQISEGEEIIFTCSIDICGKWLPSIIWTDHTGANRSFSYGSAGEKQCDDDPSSSTPPKHTVASSILIEPRVEHSGRTITARTYFAAVLDPPPNSGVAAGEREATNVLEYEYVYTSPAITVTRKCEQPGDFYD